MSKIRVISIVYIATLLLLVVYSYGFIDPNFPYSPPQFLHELVYIHRTIATVLYTCFVSVLFGCYLYFLYLIRAKKLSTKYVWQIILVTIAMLFFAYPGFSYDIFNYIATAKVLFLHGENPYIVMPIEIATEPMLAYMHAANKTALYGPAWIVITGIPHWFSFGSILGAIASFKLFVSLFYLGIAWLVYKLSNKSIYALAFFALNPLVLIETLISSHNDVVMMFFMLFSFFLLSKRLFIVSIFTFLLSIGIKFATIVLLPIYAYVFYMHLRKKKIKWNSVWKYSALFMFMMFLAAPIREEIYSWYFIWILAFVALVIDKRLLRDLSIAFSFGLLLRFAPYIYSRNWAGITPHVKLVTTTLPVLMVFLWRFFKK